jgi:hypothetical protein
MKNIIYILAFLMISCGSVKKDKSSIETESNKELNAGSNTARWIKSDNWGLEPIDLSQPMTFTNSKGETETYTNTKVFHNNTTTTEIVHDTIVVKEEFKQDANVTNKETDNNQIWLYFMVGLVVVLLFKK